jgi:hypothetical protein
MLLAWGARATQAKSLSQVELEKADDHIELRINTKCFYYSIRTLLTIS